MSDIELKPCPFCGKEPVIRGVSEYPYGNKFTLSTGYVISCDPCNLDMRMATKANVVKHWNTHHESSKVERINCDVVYLRDLDGTGSMHVCAKGDPGAVAYVPDD